MPHKKLKLSTVDPKTNKTIVKSDHFFSWDHSPRVNGKIVYRANEHVRSKLDLRAFRPYGKVERAHKLMPGSYPTLHLSPVFNRTMAGLREQSYGKLRGKLYKGSAALGVTMASWKQSREMVVARYNQMTLQATRFEERARRVLITGKSRGKRKTHQVNLKNLGSQYLEMVFGWKPLLADIHAAATTVVHTKPQVFWIGATARGILSHEYRNSPSKDRGNFDVYTYSGEVRHTRKARVTIKNENLWLRERAGLNNPGAVAWDLVPWSWVVNMFVNTSTLVNSITDFAGLKFDQAVTVEASRIDAHTVHARTSVNDSFGGKTSWERDLKRQTLGGVTTPPQLSFRVPDVNWELAGIAASLFAQKFRALEVLKLQLK